MPISTWDLHSLLSNFLKALFCKVKPKHGNPLGLDRVIPRCDSVGPLPWAEKDNRKLDRTGADPCSHVFCLVRLAPVPSAIMEPEHTPATSALTESGCKASRAALRPGLGCSPWIRGVVLENGDRRTRGRIHSPTPTEVQISRSGLRHWNSADFLYIYFLK